MKHFSLFLAIVVLCTHSGCATIVSGKSQDVHLRSNPSGAAVKIDGALRGETPLIASLRRNKRHEIQIGKERYVEETRTTKRGFNWWFTGNIIFGGIIGIIVDFATGAVYSVEPDEITVELTEKA